jgi:hypothetical protein
VAFMLEMGMAIVQVVDVAGVLHHGVAAVRPVRVPVFRMSGVCLSSHSFVLSVA